MFNEENLNYFQILVRKLLRCNNWDLVALYRPFFGSAFGEVQISSISSIFSDMKAMTYDFRQGLSDYIEKNH